MEQQTVKSIIEQLNRAHLSASPPSSSGFPKKPLFTSIPSRRCLWEDAQPAVADQAAALAPIQDWGRVTADILSQVVAMLPLADVRAVRLVCQHWRDSISQCVSHLRPRGMPSGSATSLSSAFPALQSLDLKGCQRKLLDTNVDILRSVTGLRELSLEGCEGVTDAAAQVMAALPRLAKLNLKNCLKVTDVTLWTLCGAEEKLTAGGPTSPLRSPRRWPAAASTSASDEKQATQQHAPRRPPLRSLNLSGCVLLTEEGFKCLSSGMLELTELCLGGHSRVATVTDAAMVGVGGCSNLVTLDLSGCCSLSAEGLRSLSSLHSLRSLNLWNCLRLSSEALEALRPLTNLTALCLRGCQSLGDSALQHIAVLRLLRRLDLRACEHIRGEQMFRLAALKQLTELNLWGCYALSDSGLERVGQISSLKVLRLNECWQLTNAGLAALRYLMGLKELDLAGCRNVINPARSALDLKPLSSLTSLSLRGCDRLTVGALEFLSGTPSLRHLDLSGCRDIDSRALEPLHHISASLASLKLQHCVGLKGAGALTHLRPLNSLTSLHLGGCINFVGTALGALSPLSNLQQLSLEGCVNIPLLHRGLATVGRSCHALTSLNLQGCNTLTDEGLQALSPLPNLISTVLSDCAGVTGVGCESWGCHSTLTSLSLQGVGLTDAGAKRIAELTALRELSIKNCREVGDSGAAALAATLRGLTALSLQGMGIEDKGIAALANMTALQALELQFCWKFSDHGATKLTALTNLRNLDLLYSWQVGDESMQALGRMTSLTKLNIMGLHRLSSGGKAAVEHILTNSLHE